MIRAASLRGFEALVAELGGDPHRLLNSFGIGPAALSSDDVRVSITAHDRMLDAAALELRCPDLGLRLAERQDLTILGQLSLAIEASETVRDALDCASRFLFIHSPALQIGIEPDPRAARGVLALTYRKDLHESLYSPQAIELGLGLFHHVVTMLVGSSGLRSVELPHPPQSPVARYLDFFGTEVRFGGPTAALRVERSFLDRRFASANRTIRLLAMEHLAAQHPDPNITYTARVRRAIAEILATGLPSLVQVSRLFALNPRTLQRRLAAEDTNFEALLESVRRDAVHRYLTTTNLPLGQVASMVGFSEQSSLSHAVRRWFGLSPRDLRRAGMMSPVDYENAAAPTGKPHDEVLHDSGNHAGLVGAVDADECPTGRVTVRNIPKSIGVD